MRPVASGLILVLMTFWTAVALADIAAAAQASGWVGQLTATDPGALGAALERARAAAFSDAGQARAVVWGLPMLVFAVLLSLLAEPS